MGEKIAVPDGRAPLPLSRMLAAREARWQRRMMLSAHSPVLISITLCVPLPFRTDPRGRTILAEAAEALRGMLRNQSTEAEAAEGFFGRDSGPGTAPDEFMDGPDGPCLFLSCRGDAKAVKRLCVRAEETLPLGRFLDLDVTAQGGQPVGRAELGLPPRKCFLCGRPAAECVASSRHDPSAIAEFVRKHGFAGKETL